MVGINKYNRKSQTHTLKHPYQGFIPKKQENSTDGVIDHKESGKGFFKNGLMVGEWTWVDEVYNGKTDSPKIVKSIELEIIKGGIDIKMGDHGFPSYSTVDKKINTYEDIDYILTYYYHEGNKSQEISFIGGEKTYKLWNEDGSVKE